MPDHTCRQADLAQGFSLQQILKFWYGHAVVSEGALRQGRLHTLVTSCFSHQSGGHLFANMFTFYFFGRSLANIVGGQKVWICHVHVSLVAFPPLGQCCAACALLPASLASHVSTC